jgi:thioesterase domain-containing protein
MRLTQTQDREALGLCVPIQRGVLGAAPVFCVPGAGANVTSFVPLAAALGGDLPLYGLQPRGLDAGEQPFASVEEAAQTYLPLLKRVAPRGPYRLLGHSFGGWVAFELARRLNALGDPAAPVILVDVDAPCDEDACRASKHGTEALMELVGILEQRIERALGISQQDFAYLPEDQWIPLLARAMAAAGLLSPRTEIGAVEAIARVFETSLNIRYRPPSPMRGPAVLVRAGASSLTESRDHRPDPFVAWRAFCPQLRIVTITGNHMTMLAEPHVGDLAQIVRNYWRAETSHN